MVLTEKEARERWCPAARIARHEEIEVRTPGTGSLEVVHREQFIPGGCNRDALGLGGKYVLNSCKCIATDCMAWRWQDPATETVPNPNDVNGAPVKIQRGDRRRGYCGLAGGTRVD